jgi:hypothetical protein
MYEAIKSSLGHHMTLDPSVPARVGCAEAVSAVLRKAGVPVPARGIAGTSALLLYCLNHPQRYTEIYTPEPAALLISASGTGNGKLSNGHTGFFGRYGTMVISDWGICSNDSQSGLFLELWTWKKWKTYYEQYGGMRPRIFRVNI